MVDLLGERYREDYAFQTACEVVERGWVAQLYECACGRVDGLGRGERESVQFRAAYVLETIFFIAPESFAPLTEAFFRDFAECRNSSAKRHFAKIMATLLDTHIPSPKQANEIATAAAEWITQAGVRVSVQIWAMEVFLKLRHRVDWVQDILPELTDFLRRDASAGMVVRLRRWGL